MNMTPAQKAQRTIYRKKMEASERERNQNAAGALDRLSVGQTAAWSRNGYIFSDNFEVVGSAAQWLLHRKLAKIENDTLMLSAPDEYAAKAESNRIQAAVNREQRVAYWTARIAKAQSDEIVSMFEGMYNTFSILASFSDSLRPEEKGETK